MMLRTPVHSAKVFSVSGIVLGEIRKDGHCLWPVMYVACDNQEQNCSVLLLSPSFSIKDNVLKMKMSEEMAQSGTETYHWGRE